MEEELGQQHYIHGYMLRIYYSSLLSVAFFPCSYNLLLGLCCLKGCDDQHYMYCASVICSPSSYANCDEDCIRTYDQDFIIRYSHNSFTTPICIGMWYTALCSCVTACQQHYVEVPLLCDVIMHQNAIMLALMYVFIMREQRERTAIIHVH